MTDRGRGGASGEILGGILCIVVGLALWRFAGGVEVPFFALDKVGVILALVGAAGLVYGVFLRARR